MKFELKERYVAYFDVLGYKSAFESKRFDVKKYLNKIKGVIKKVKASMPSAKDIRYCIKTFSDNACIVVDDEQCAIPFLKLVLSYLQYSVLMKYGLLIRGAISFGEIYVDNGLIFGQALIDCVQFEETAKYPRIIISDDLGEKFKENDGYLYVEQGLDGKYEIIYMQDYEDDDIGIVKLRKKIIEVVNANCKQTFDDDDSMLVSKEAIIPKYMWLITTFNAYHSLYTITYKVEMQLNGHLELEALN